MSPARDFRSPLFPYEPSFITVEVAGQSAALSYVEAGPADGELLVLLHGNPTWSFLYRDIIPILATGQRVLALDYLGFGRSDKLDRYEDYTLANHLSAMTQLFDKLELDAVTLVVHDWAGPIGLSYAVDHPERIARLVIMNTWAFAPKPHNKVPQPLKTFRRRPLGEWLVLGLNGFVNVVLPFGVVKRGAMRGPVMAAYRKPFPNWRSRWPVLAFPRHIPLRMEDAAYPRMKQTDETLRSLAQPTLLLWGERDPVFPPRVMGKFRERLPNVVGERTFADASHFLQEDCPAEIARLIADFVEAH